MKLKFILSVILGVASFSPLMSMSARVPSPSLYKSFGNVLRETSVSLVSHAILSKFANTTLDHRIADAVARGLIGSDVDELLDEIMSERSQAKLLLKNVVAEEFEALSLAKTIFPGRFFYLLLVEGLGETELVAALYDAIVDELQDEDTTLDDALRDLIATDQVSDLGIGIGIFELLIRAHGKQVDRVETVLKELGIAGSTAIPGEAMDKYLRDREELVDDMIVLRGGARQIVDYIDKIAIHKIKDKVDGIPSVRDVREINEFSVDVDITTFQATQLLSLVDFTIEFGKLSAEYSEGVIDDNALIKGYQMLIGEYDGVFSLTDLTTLEAALREAERGELDIIEGVERRSSIPKKRRLF